jgi:hypothetical protein
VASTALLWDPPDGMPSPVVTRWRAFYRSALANYGMTPAEYRLLYVAQKGRCWICRTAKGVHPDDPKGAGGRRLGVDHDHRTGQVRGLLCTGGDKTCNRIIGWLTAPQLQRAADYLRTPRAQPARVIGEIQRAAENAAAAGADLTDEDMDALAVAYLWPHDD